MKKITFDKILTYLLLVAVLGIGIYILKNETGQPKLAFIDIGKMQEGYKFKKDLEAEGTKNLYKIKNTIDSLKMIQKLGTTALIDSQIAYAERAFEQYYTYSNQEMTKKIWERLNPLLQEYGKSKKIALIIGANGAGTVLYGDIKNDLTEDAIIFINQKYEKGN